MDSFYDAPRQPPIPSDLGRFSAFPIVPEVSLLNNNHAYDESNNFASYNKWKTEQDTLKYGNQPNSSILKKQVRFQAISEQPLNNYQNCFYANAQTDRQYVKPQIQNQNGTAGPPNMINKDFEQIYMANIPNRQLDLSMLDVPPPINYDKLKDSAFNHSTTKNDSAHNSSTIKPTNDLPETYRDFLTLQRKNDQLHNDNTVTDILNYNREKVNHRTLEDSSNKVKVTEKKSPQSNYNKISLEDSLFLQKNTPKIPQEMFNPTKTYNNNEDAFTGIHQRETRTYESRPMYENFTARYNNHLNTKCDNNTQTSTVVAPPNNDEPTVKDLLKIIQQQNEQLILLQKQVANLIEYNNESAPKQIEPPPYNNNNDKYVTSSRHEHFRNTQQVLSDMTNKSPRKAPQLSKFSIDLMTSFEVSFRPQQNMYQRNKLKDYPNYEPKIQEITEVDSVDSQSNNKHTVNDNTTRNMEQSLRLEEPLDVRETCPSPDPEVKINMNDFDESDEEGSSAGNGASFYANLMDQVNNILKKAQIQPSGEYRRNHGNENAAFNNTTMHKVKEATMKHLQTIGVNLPPMEDMNSSDRTNDSAEFTPTEVSFAVKQLLMKYLPDEHLSKLTNNHKPKAKNPHTEQQFPNSKENLIRARPEFSFATVQYMKKYNLLGNDNSNKDAVVNNAGSPKHLPQYNAFDKNHQTKKILDISALKQQPKLL